MQECWGIGPSKAAEGGFGWDLAEELKSKEVVERLVESRKAGVPKEKEEQEEGEAQGECESGDGRADEAESPAKQESKEENSDEKDGDR